MDWQIAYTLAVVFVALVAMVRQIAAPDLVLMAALFSLAVVGILTPTETFAGFGYSVAENAGILIGFNAYNASGSDDTVTVQVDIDF